jgi:cyclic pyranopterin phosphate synthase
MSERVIPLVDQRIASLTAPVPAQPIVADGLLSDALGRPLNDLRISVTDRCNFRCNYCMPKEVFDKDYPYLPHGALLTFEEITRTAKLFVAHGVRKIRLTGGEPLLRKNIEVLIEQLAALRTPDGQPLDLTLTTNGSLLARKARSLKAAGLKRVTVSLDGLDDAVFRAMNDVDFPVADVLEGIEAARAAGLGSGEPGHSLKINMVVKRGTNEHEILRMARHFQRHRHRAALHRVHGRGRHQRLAHGRSAAQRRRGENDPCRAAAGAARPLGPGRNRRALGLR